MNTFDGVRFRNSINAIKLSNICLEDLIDDPTAVQGKLIYDSGVKPKIVKNINLVNNYT